MIERKYYVEAGHRQSEIADYLLAIKHDARALTIRYLRDITQEELDWQPFEGWNSVAALLAHIIACDRYFRIAFIEERDFTKEEENEIMPGVKLGEYVTGFNGKPLDYYLEQLNAAHQESKAAISSMKPEQFLRRRFTDYDKVNGSDLAWILFHSAEDEVHHRGQISIVRKLYKEMKAKKP